MGVFDILTTGSVTYVSAQTGFSQAAQLLNNTSTSFNYLTLPFGGPWNFNPADTWTLDFWYQCPGTTPTATAQMLFSIGTVSTECVRIQLLSTGVLQTYLNASGEAPISTSATPGFSTTWHHVRYIQLPAPNGTNSKGRYLVFLDGVLALDHSLAGGAGPIVSAASPLVSALFGNYVRTGVSYNGLIDEIAVFTTALGTPSFAPFTPPPPWVGNETSLGIVALYHLDNSPANAGPGVIRVSPNTVPTNATNISFDGLSSVTNQQMITVTNFGVQNWTTSGAGSLFNFSAGQAHLQVVNTTAVPQTALIALETPSTTTPITVTGPNGLMATITPVATPFIAAVTSSVLAINSTVSAFAVYAINTAWGLNTLPSPASLVPNFGGIVGSGTPQSNVAVSNLTVTMYGAAVTVQKAVMTLATGTLAGPVVITENADSATYTIQLVVAQASVSPTIGTVLTGGAGQTTFTASVLQTTNQNCNWVCSAGTFTGGVTTASNVSSVVWTPPASPASVTITATSVATGTVGQASITVVGPILPGGGLISLSSTASVDTITTLGQGPQVGTNRITALGLYVGSARGGETGPVATIANPTFPGAAFTHPVAAPGTMQYYVVRAVDSQGTVGAPSNEVANGTSALPQTGAPISIKVTYSPIGGPGTGTTGLVGSLGIAVYDALGLTLLPRSTATIAEQANNGVYTATLLLYPNWSGTFLWDSLPGYVSSKTDFDPTDTAEDLWQLLANSNGKVWANQGQFASLGGAQLIFTDRVSGAVVATFDLAYDSTGRVSQRVRV